MKILMIANFVGFSWEGANSRFIYLLNKLDCKKNQVELITSNFKHGVKKRRSELELKETNYKITLINEPGYKKNVSIKRVLSHKQFANNVKKHLKQLPYKPDIIYCAVPPLSVADVVVKYANKNNIKFVIDIQDLWPEAFQMVFNMPIIKDIIFYPMMRKANYIYSHSDEIVAVSDTYVNRGLRVNKKLNKGLSVYLGTDLKYFDEWKKRNIVKFNDNIIRICYIGTLGTSYDIISIIDAIKLLNHKGINNVRFIVMGDGPLRDKFEQYAKDSGIDYEFTGRLEYPKMIELLSSCDIAVNPIVGKSVASIINKVGDYAAAGLPVINTQECDEYKELLIKYNAGINCKNGDVEDISNGIERLVKDKNLRSKLGKGNRKLAIEKFDRDKTYDKIIDEIISSD